MLKKTTADAQLSWTEIPYIQRVLHGQVNVALLPYEEDQRDVLAHDAHVLVAELLAYNPVVRVVKEHNLLADRGVRRVMATAQNRMERKRLRGTLRIFTCNKQ